MRKPIFDKVIIRLKKLVEDWGKANVYLVGGCVRDEILNTQVIKDIDLVIDLENGSELFCKYLEEQGAAKDFVIYPRFGTSKFSLLLDEKEIPIECVIPRSESYNLGPRKPDSIKYTTIKEDATRRDFCCNALYKNIVTGELLDPTGYGVEDIKNKVLRTPLPAKETFIDDPLRMLRAFRFYAEKGFKILPEVFSEIRPYPEYYKLSMERIRDEFSRILLSNRPVEVIRDLHKTKLLSHIIPELEESWGFNQNSHYHSMNLTDHSFSVLEEVRKDSTNNINLLMAALLHDIAKYKCWVKKNNGEFSYPEHEIESAKMAVSIMNRLKFSNDNIKIVEKLIKEHMRLKSLYDPKTDTYTGQSSTTRKIVRSFGENLSDCLKLIDADNKSHAPKYNMPGQVTSFLGKVQSLDVVSFIRSCPVSGDKIMKYFDLKPGPLIKEIKDIFLDWLDINPNLTEKELIEKYRFEFDNKTFWVYSYRDYYEYSFITSVKPTLVNGVITTDPFEIPYEALGICLGNNILQEWKAIEHPILYKKFKRFQESRNIVENAVTSLEKLVSYPEFKGISLELDEMLDLSGTIKWSDSKPDYIM